MSAAYGLIGYPLSHSFSPGYFTTKFQKEGIEATYNLYPIPTIEAFCPLLKEHPELAGLNVTIPYKEKIIPYLDELDETAREIGAVNCIKISNSITRGYNTDVIGFKQSLFPLLQPYHKKALILGTGGASLAVAFVLRQLDIDYLLVSRTSSVDAITYQELDKDLVSEHKLIINTTPLGMYPDIASCPDISYDTLGKEHLLYDLIYNPGETLFLAKGKQHGATTRNGLEMLELQADASWQIWNS